jgi:hypothetical protein
MKRRTDYSLPHSEPFPSLHLIERGEVHNPGFWRLQQEDHKYEDNLWLHRETMTPKTNKNIITQSWGI